MGSTARVPSWQNPRVGDVTSRGWECAGCAIQPPHLSSRSFELTVKFPTVRLPAANLLAQVTRLPLEDLSPAYCRAEVRLGDDELCVQVTSHPAGECAGRPEKERAQGAFRSLVAYVS